MGALFSSGHAADIIFAILAVEALWLRTRGHRLTDITATLLPAALIVLGLRAALTGTDWPWIAIPLAAALPIHIWDLSRRDMLRRTKH
ncbi:MAG: hypothetical protein AAGE05_01575 [Pseudomonadota bacterium]